MKLSYRLSDLTGFSEPYTRLVEDPASVAGLLPACASDGQALLNCARRFAEQAQAPSDEIFGALLSQNLRLGAHPRAVENIHRLKDAAALVVGATAGPVLFGGPMELYYRVFTVLKVCGFLSGQGITAVPVLAVREAGGLATSRLLDMQNSPQTLALSASAGALSLLGELRGYLPATDYAEELFAEMEGCFTGDGDAPAGEIRLLTRLLSRLGVVVLATDNPAYATLQGLLESRLRDSEDRVQHGTQRKWEEMRAMGLAAGRPEGSGAPRDDVGTLSRRVLPWALFPWFARVCGSDEVGGHALLRPLLDALGLRDPAVLPAASVTLVEPKVSKVLEKFDLELLDFLPSRTQEMEETVAARFEWLRPGEGFEAAENGVRNRLNGLREVLNSRHSSLARSYDEVEERIVYQLQSLKGRQQQSWERQREIARQQMDKARNYLFPEGRRQEEFLGVSYFLIRHGFGLLDAICGQVEPFTREHRIMLYPGPSGG